MSTRKILDYARPAALVILLVVTAVGVYKFATGDWTDVVQYWRGHLAIIPLLIGFSVLDVILESTAWMWSYARLKIHVFDRAGATICLAGRAGLLMPAQLGRLIRPDAIVRLGRASMTESLKAEAVMFVLDGVSVLALLTGLLVYKVNPWLALPATMLVAIVLVYPGDRLAELLAHTRLNFPAKFWWSWPSMGIVVVQMAGWVAHGMALFVVVAGLPGAMTLWDSLFFAPGAALVGTSTGLPGGIGATEGILGASLRFRQIPVEHLAIVVTAFRLITFWAWIPIGWLALLAVKRRHADPAVAVNVGGLGNEDGSE
jgi:glycosyltransferase 2 family protein